MPPLLQEALGAFVRWLLTFAAGWFVQRGIWTAEKSEAYVAAAAIAILTLAWSLWQKYKNRALLNTALSMPPTTLDDAKQRVKDGHGQPAMGTGN